MVEPGFKSRQSEQQSQNWSQNSTWLWSIKYMKCRNLRNGKLIINDVPLKKIFHTLFFFLTFIFSPHSLGVVFFFIPFSSFPCPPWSFSLFFLVNQSSNQFLIKSYNPFPYCSAVSTTMNELVCALSQAERKSHNWAASWSPVWLGLSTFLRKIFFPLFTPVPSFTPTLSNVFYLLQVFFLIFLYLKLILKNLKV